MKFKLTYFRTITLNETLFVNKIEDVLSRLIDPIDTFEIPNDPTRVHYVSQNQFRILSAESLKEMLAYKQTRLDYIDECKKDKSQIARALQQTQNLTPLEMKYRAFLLECLIAAQLSYDEIQSLCTLFEEKWRFYSEIDPQLKDKDNFGFIRSAIPAKHQAKFDRFAECFTPELMANFTPISSFAGQLASQQSSNYKSYQEYKETFGNLHYDEIFCPATRQVIDGKKSQERDARDAASNFIAIYMVLAVMAAVKADEIRDFLNRKAANYIQQCEQTLYRYLQNPRLFGFTRLETQLLLDMGVAKIKLTFKGDYGHLWPLHEATPKQNVLTILQDYSKLDSPWPQLSLFFTAHRGRNHHEAVQVAVRAIIKGGKLDEVLNALESSARNHPLFNEEGSLMRRLRYIDMQRGPRQGLVEVSGKTPQPEVVFSPN